MRRKWPRWVGSIPIIFGATNAGLAVAQNAFYASNWSGYFATAPAGETFSDISATWVVPTVIAPASGKNYSADWVGFDGVYDSTVEQCGTSGDIASNGAASYYAWYEFYNLPEEQIPLSTLTPHPGDTINAEVTYEPNQSSIGNYVYSFNVTDLTDNQSFVATETTASNDSRSSAEWIAEAPTVNGSQANFANYGSVTFSNDVAAAVPTGSVNPGIDLPMGAYSDSEVIAIQSSVYISTPTASIPPGRRSISSMDAISSGTTPTPPPRTTD